MRPTLVISCFRWIRVDSCRVAKLQALGFRHIFSKISQTEHSFMKLTSTHCNLMIRESLHDISSHSATKILSLISPRKSPSKIGSLSKNYFLEFWYLECANFTICLHVCSLHMVCYYLPPSAPIPDLIFIEILGGPNYKHGPNLDPLL